jgi:hypothetical protein
MQSISPASQLDVSALTSFQGSNAGQHAQIIVNAGGTFLDGNNPNTQISDVDLISDTTFTIGSNQTYVNDVNSNTLNVTNLLVQGRLNLPANYGTIDVHGSLSFDGSGYLSNATAGTVKVSGNLLGTTTNASQFNQYAGGFGIVTFDGSGTAGSPQQFEAMSNDLGAVQSGWTTNFAYGTLSLTNNTYVKLVDLADNAAGAGNEAVYVRNLVVPAGNTLDLDGLHLYVRTSTIGGTILNGTVSTVSNSAVVNEQVFYKGSTAWDTSGQPILPFSDDNAIAMDKTAYLPGAGAAAFANVSSYTRGLNGLIVDLAGTHGTITANDFIFKVGNNNSPSTWSTATAPTLVTTRAGAGLGADRIELMWANNAIQKTWLEVIVKGNDALGGSNTNTGLASSYVFYFGNALGDSGAGDSTTFVVNSTDEISARNDPHSTLSNPASIINVDDYNRDGNVNSTDQIAARNNPTSALSTALKFLTVGAGGPFAPLSEASAGGPATATSLTASPSSAGATEPSDDDNALASALAAGTAGLVVDQSPSTNAPVSQPREVAPSPGLGAAVDLSLAADLGELSAMVDDLYDPDEGLLDLLALGL